MTSPISDSGNAPLLVGRYRERSLLHAQFDAALAGHGGLVILSGEAGIGKTTLAEDACRKAGDSGALVLTGHCYDGANTPPYGPWIEILDQFQTLSAQSRAPVRDISTPDLSGGTSQAAHFSVMHEFFSTIARERPLVIVLEDMHWADSASLDLLRVVARHITSVSVALLMTYRSDEVTRNHPLYQLLPILVREALAVRIDLSPLSDDDVQALIKHDYRLTDEETLRLVNYVQAHADGNPFFVSELLRSLEGATLTQTESNSWRLGELAPIQIPVLLQQVIDARLARLGDDADNALAIAAVIGEVVPLELWAKVCQTTEESLFPLIERGVEARVFSASADGLTVHFTHALVHEALYQRMLPSRRRVYHRLIGEMLDSQSRSPEFDEIAYHFSQAGDPRAVAWLIRAGERAQRAFAYRVAAQRFEIALKLLEKDESEPNQRGWLNFRLALLRRFQDPVSGVDLLATAERLGRETSDAALVAYARYFRAMLRRISGNFQRWLAAAEEGIALLDALSPEDHARLAALDTTSDPLDGQNGRGDLALALGEIGPFSRAVELGEQIVSLPPAETRGSRGDACYGLGYAYSALGQPEAARNAFSHAREIFRGDDHRSMVLATLFDELVAVVLPYQTDQPFERDRLETQLTDAFVALEDIFDSSEARMARLVSDVLEGNWDDAIRTVRESSPRYIRLMAITVIAPIARHQGNAALAWSLIHEALPAGPETAPGDSAGFLLPLRMLAVALTLDAGDHDAARRWLDSLERWLEWSGGVFGRAGAHLAWAAYHQVTGDAAAARTRAEQALAAAGAPRQALALLIARRVLGGLALAAGRLDDAEREFTAAQELADACGALHERAMILLAQAELARVRGDHTLARMFLADVRALCVPMGATLTLKRADALEARLNAAPATGSNVLPAGLTAREGDVLRLLASGLANAEIAERLSLSPRTINAHLTSIYGKLGVSSRGAAIRFALDNELG